ncbi:MAG: M50 family metallopeptidase [Deltaproteobacteria bacterium]|nr:M50 family metallopeptidase [Deltaproteobacteria bacterium]
MAMGRELSLGRPFGIPLTVNSWLAILVGIVFGFSLLTREPLEGAWILVLFVSILLHEFAHALTAKAAGDTVQKVTLHLLGGVTYRTGRGGPRWAWRITAAGPLVNVVLAGGAWLGMYYGRYELPWWGLVLLAQAFWANVILAAFNLLPIYPMDGGQLARMSLSKRVGAGAGARIGLGLSFLTLLAVGVWFIASGNFNIIAIVILVQLFMLNVMEMRQVGSPSMEETRGALGRWWRDRHRMAAERRREKERRRERERERAERAARKADGLEPSPFRRNARTTQERDAEVLRDGGRLLEKAVERGLGALRPEERRLLILHRRLLEIRIDTAEGGEPDGEDLRLLELHVRLGSSGEIH